MHSDSPDAVRALALDRAARILGGRHRLSTYLNVSAALLGLWIGGIEPAPTEVFLKAVDVIEAEVVASLKNPR